MKSSFKLFLSQYQSILDSISDGVLAINADMTIIFFNRAAERITKVPRSEAVGRRCFEVMRVEICESACCLKQTMFRGERCEDVPVYIVRADNKRIPIAVTTSVMLGKDGQVIGGVETFRDLSEINQLRQAFFKAHAFENIISKNNKMTELFTILPQVAESRASVLIQGDSGTGKELFARAIHNQGPRKKEPFIAINCGALPETLIESELFGYKAGAFTDARRDKPGRFALAGEGTIFLDEIGDISPAMQVRLLRVLENRTFSPLGSTKTLQMKARVITATHRDLEALVAQNAFRQDLYFRINVVKLKLPKLTDRREDIPLLVTHFIDRFNTITGKRIAGVTDAAMAALMRHHWPGNVRELENALEHAFVLCRSGMIDLPHLPEHVWPTVQDAGTTGGLSLREHERQVVLNALVRNRWRRMATARELKIDKNTLRRKIEAYGLRPPQN
ncbi:MAG TPA: PAS domain-containing protein [Desulfobacteraceae bacterium]|nr:sigma 54-interacting transcriptional regulator [Deltaproteobacteria bacterium]HDI60251.1 PAS domain-containing protein [Desulfobacteraceae bacterium]